MSEKIIRTRENTSVIRDSSSEHLKDAIRSSDQESAKNAIHSQDPSSFLKVKKSRISDNTKVPTSMPSSSSKNSTLQQPGLYRTENPDSEIPLLHKKRRLPDTETKKSPLSSGFRSERNQHKNKETPIKKEARYGTVEDKVNATELIGGAAGDAKIKSEKQIIKNPKLGVAGRSSVKPAIQDTVKGRVIKKSKGRQQAAEAERQKKAKKSNLKSSTDQISEELKNYSYKAGKYAALAPGKLTKEICSYTNPETVLKKPSLKKSIVSPVGVIKKGVHLWADNFEVSDDFGTQTLIASKSVAMRSKQTFQLTGGALRGTIKGVKKTAKTVSRVLKKISGALKKAFSNPAVLKASLISGLIVLLIALLITAASSITSIFPVISLKSEETELTKTYDYITELDAKLTDKLRHISAQEEYSYIDEYHFYVNGYATTADEITISTNADYLLLYFDCKYEDYSFDDNLIFGVAKRNSVKEEIDSIHHLLHAYDTTVWEEEVEHETEDRDWTEIKYHLDINITTTSFESYLSDNFDTLLTPEQQELYKVLNEVGIYTAHQDLGNPFAASGGYYFISDRWGWRLNPSTGALEHHDGVGIQQSPGTDISNVLSGTVVETGSGRYGQYVKVKSSTGKKEILYGYLSSVQVSKGDYLKQGDILGKTGAGDSAVTPSLYIEYRLNGSIMNPTFFLSGASCIGTNKSDNIIAVAATQFGNVGGKPYWSWYGFRSRVSWCACFVSWCADQCGYIHSGIIPQFCYCPTGAGLFKNRGIWKDRGYIPQKGDIIFFDFKHEGEPHHVGFVESCDGAIIHTIEGNSRDRVKRNSYSVFSNSIYGYATPAYPVEKPIEEEVEEAEDNAA